MNKSSATVIFFCISVLCPGQSAPAQDRDTISAIPRVDVHSHVGSVERMGHYVKVAEVLKDQHGINLAAWIDLNFMRQSDGTEQEYLNAAANRFEGRFLPCINDFKISDGLRFSPDELVKWQEKGIVGYKIYLMYVLKTYPNVNVDLGARFQQFHRMDTDKLRKFMIEHADRILFGTDIGGQPREGRYEQVAESYHRTFQLLETDRVIKGGFFGGTETKGLALPVDVLEKIYYRNAARLYPRIKDVLRDLGYGGND